MSREELRKVRRQWRDELKPRALSRMIDRKRQRMQRLPLEAIGFIAMRAAVKFIAKARMPNRREMHSYLMHPASLGLDPSQRSARTCSRRWKTA